MSAKPDRARHQRIDAPETPNPTTTQMITTGGAKSCADLAGVKAKPLRGGLRPALTPAPADACPPPIEDHH